jgi:hypothetical protein
VSRTSLLLVLVLFTSADALAQDTLLDNFDTVVDWKPITSGGVSMSIEKASGYSGKCMAIHFKFSGGSGYAIAEKSFPIALPPNYIFTFYYRGDTPVNNFEFKLLDSLGNVFWLKQLNIHYPVRWTRKAVRKRDITFAWGPSGGGTIQKVDSIQFVVSAGTGGTGTIYIDDFRLEPMVPDSTPLPIPAISASSNMDGHPAGFAIDANNTTYWESSGKSKTESLTIDRRQLRDLGGLTISWEGKAFASEYNVELSDNGFTWDTAYQVSEGNGGTDNIFLSESDARYVRLNFLKSNYGNEYAISDIAIRGIAFGTSLNAFFDSVAQQSPRGYYPKYFTHEQSYWTVVGADGDSKSALINEQGQIEVEKCGFSIEPFVYFDDSLTTWYDVTTSQSLEKKLLPIPSVNWKVKQLHLKVTALAAGKAGKSVLMMRYKVTNCGNRMLSGKLLLAVRPFQVDPPWQFLNDVGGVSTISDISYHGCSVDVDDRNVIPMTTPDGFGATTFDSGDITEYISRGRLPQADSVHDHFAHASAALEYSFALAVDSSMCVYIAVPFHKASGGCVPNMKAPRVLFKQKLAETEKFWQSKTDKVDIRLPGSAQDIVNTVKSNLAYILINRDGPALQPGTRSYDRSWIRDGSMMSATLLRFGITKPVREYIDWYSHFIYPSGKVPCVVDSRGADPVPENDSHGEYIYAVMQYFRFTHDTTWLREKFPSVVHVVRYIESLRRREMTDENKHGTAEQRVCYGLVPASISHEGYSNHPEHSYWDDFFVMLGLKDAASMARILSAGKYEKEFAAERDDFRKCIYSSMRLAMKDKNIDYIPGCVELGDFDATSTTIGIDPTGELENIPEPQLRNTFEKYYRYFKARKNNSISWDAYTPYETRIIGSFIYLGEKRKAHELTDFFMKDRRASHWNEWPEVIWKDRNTPKFIGDMPHAWVGSDFIRSIRAMFAYERESDSALVIGAGIPGRWVNDTNKVVVKGLPTYWGKLNYSVGTSNGKIDYLVSGKIDFRKCHLVVESPLEARIKSAEVNGVRVPVVDGRSVEMDRLPARVQLDY